MNRDWIADSIRFVASASLLPHRLRPFFLRLSGVAVGKRVLIMPGLCVPRKAAVLIGNDVFVNYCAYFDNDAEISIGDNVQLGNHVRLVTSTHELGPSQRRAGHSLPKPISIGRGCWIGAGVTVLPGVTISDGCVIAAGSVVVSSCAENGLYAGVPALRKRDLD